MLGPGLDAAIGENRFEGRADRDMADDARPARMDTDNVFIIRPASHQTLDIGRLQRVVKGGFGFFRTGSQELDVGLGFGHKAGDDVKQARLCRPSCSRPDRWT
jgi:hypothetical protein